MIRICQTHATKLKLICSQLDKRESMSFKHFALKDGEDVVIEEAKKHMAIAIALLESLKRPDYKVVSTEPIVIE